MLSEKELETISKQLVVMRIIHLGLAAGVAAFAVYLLAQREKLVPFGSGRDYAFLGFGLLAAVAGWIVPRVIGLDSMRANQAQLATTDPEAHEVLQILAGIQTAMIIGCAIFEGGAFANLVSFLMKHDPLNLAMAGVLLLFILMQFPRRGAVLDKVETKLRRQGEAKEMIGLPR